MKKHCLFLLFILLLAIPAVGQVPTGSTEKAENIRKLLTLVGAEKLQQNMIDQMMTALKPALTNSVTGGDQRTQKAMERMTELLTEELKKSDLLRITTELYDKHFTNDDIKGLIQFYESPVGQKALQVLPVLTQEALARGMEAGQVAAQRAVLRLADEYPEIKAALNGAAPKK